MEGLHGEWEVTALLLLVLLRISLYPLLLAGWTSNRKYALIGAVRGVAQTLSYEISLAIVFFCFFCLSKSFSLLEVSSSSRHLLVAVLGLPLIAL